ncbi:MAG: DNA cytosine methyltransferase [Desulfobacteraceae bacterium]|nr:DNA cytosine methyltransferase [Desulfobacteraceae bacterium]
MELKLPTPIRFVDVFAGCGGLSLGLLNAGCEGVFAIEKSPLAFETLRTNLVDGTNHKFNWPTWLPKQAMTCEELLKEYRKQLLKLRGHIDLIVGGPPCQGFSTAGRRDPADPRNRMTEQYLDLVELLKPSFLVIENVAGFNMSFEGENFSEALGVETEKSTYSEYVASRLDGFGYHVSRGIVNCADFGVPQNRLRYLMLCERKRSKVVPQDLRRLLQESRLEFLLDHGLPTDRFTTVKEAISDLEITGKELIPNEEPGGRRFKESKYCHQVGKTAYLNLMRMGSGDEAPNSRRLANHRVKTIEYFKRVQSICRPGFCMSMEERAMVGTKKHSTTVLNSTWPSPTITTLPDDIIHYSEPRILTVREHARIQSFPDWFAFQGKYTTGGKQRKQECPRYTQVGNAVPPLLATAIGRLIKKRHLQIATRPVKDNQIDS